MSVTVKFQSVTPPSYVSHRAKRIWPVTTQQHRRPMLQASQVARREKLQLLQRMRPWQRRAVQSQVPCVPQSDFRCVKPHVHLAVTARLFYSHMHKCDVTLAKCCQCNTYRVKYNPVSELQEAAFLSFWLFEVQQKTEHLWDFLAAK